jgi:FlaA1/EpsC-like NDP-sugar epimerase
MTAAPTSSPFQPRSNHWENVLRVLSLVVAYSAVIVLCRYFAYEVRFDFIVPEPFQQERLVSIAFNLPIKLAALLLFRQFGSLLTYFSVPDLMRIAAAIAVANFASLLVRLGLTPEMTTPRGVILIDFVLVVGALSSLRLGFRIYRERFSSKARAGSPRKSRNIVVLGAGDAGAQFVQEAQSRPSLGLRPVFFLDDDWNKHGRHVHGIQVLGAPEEIVRWRKDYEVEAAVLAMPSAPVKRVQEIYKLLAAEGLKVEIVPSLAELATGRVQVTKIRPVEVEDLLGRAAVDLQSEDVGELVAGKCVLVTGAGGSIGSELCRQLCGYRPQRVLLVEQSEGSLFTIESELNGKGYASTIVPLVADILDLPRMQAIFARYRPAVVFHAAAHKHVYMMERQPGEAVKNNTTGTRQLAELAIASGVETFVFISTDKAINPTSVMGASKRLAEMHLQAIAARAAMAPVMGDGSGVMGAPALPAGSPRPSGAGEGGGRAPLAGNPEPITPNPEPIIRSAAAPRTRFIAVRFGNVLGSSGSVIPIFKQQIAAGGPVTVTHPDVTRYFMTIPEAVGLVLKTAVLGENGRIYVLDMGKPMKIVDLARQLIELSGLRPGEDIEIEFIGLRPGEKLFEELQHRDEQLKATTHPRIFLLAADSPPPPDWVQACQREVEHRVTTLEPEQLKLAIKSLVPEYSPHLEAV